MGRYQYTAFACYIGAFTQAATNNFAPLIFLTFFNEFGISLGKISFLITLNFCTQMLVDFLGAGLADFFGYRKAIVAAHVFAAAGLAELGILPYILPSPYIGLCIAVVTGAVGSGLIEVMASPIVEALPGDAKASAMSVLHSFYCWGLMTVILVSTAYFYFFGIALWRWLAMGWALIPAVNAVIFSRVPINTLESERGQSLKMTGLFKNKIFWVFLLLMFGSGAAEQALGQWISVFVESDLAVPKTLGDLLGTCVFAMLMGISRLLFGKFGDSVNLRKVTFVGGCVCFAGFLIASLSPWKFLSLAGCGICGFAVGIMWPGVISQAAKLIPRGGTAMFGLLALAGDIGCFAGPDVVGFVGTALNIRAGLLCASVFALFLIIGAVILKKYSEGNDL
jgi:MFS family permease